VAGAARPYACAGIRSRAVDRADGRRGRRDRTVAQSIPLDRLSRFGDHSIRCLRYDLAGRTGGMAAAIQLSTGRVENGPYMDVLDFGLNYVGIASQRKHSRFTTSGDFVARLEKSPPYCLVNALRHSSFTCLCCCISSMKR